MFKKYKDELLEEKIEDMDQLDRIELQNKMIQYTTSCNGSLSFLLFLFLGIVINIVLLFMNMDKLDLLKSAGLYSASQDVLGTIILIVLIIIVFVVFLFKGMSSFDKNSEEVEEKIDEFIRENSV